MATEKRLIDANAYKNVLEKWESDASATHDWGVVSTMEDCIWELDAQPTVDAVEVVRCKDCKHWYEPEGVCLKIYSDGAVSPYAWQDRNQDDFCSYGERKDNVS